MIAQSTSTIVRKVAADDTVTADPGAEQLFETPQSPSPAPLQYRDRGRYKLIEEQGRGGLGRVVRAHDVELGRDVAVKELLHRNHTAELRFFREALVTARLEHPGIVPVHEAGRWSDGTPFYAMKLVGGRPLKHLLDEQATVTKRLAFLPNILAVADAIAYAHDNRIIHRDLKPSNVMVGEFGETIVIDWGLAKALDEPSDLFDTETPYRTAPSNELTGVGDVLGTPAYMAPEQYGGQVDHRADIYALGGILHHILTGAPPHAAPVTDRKLQHRDAPEDLVAIAKHAMDRDPTARYQTARAFGDDLRSFMRHERVVARRYSVPARVALAFARYRTVALVLAAALVALTVTLAISMFNIAHERVRAVDAQRAAVVSNATALLTRDPTHAWNSLDSVLPDVDTALLRARIRAAGVADSTVKLSGRLDVLETVEGTDKIAISTGDRKLGVLDSRTSAWRDVATDLTDPAIWTSTTDRIYFVRREATGLALESAPLRGGPNTLITKLSEVPEHIEANNTGVYWLTSSGELYKVPVGRSVQLLGHNVDHFLLLTTELVVCNHDGAMRVGAMDRIGARVSTCMKRPMWTANGSAFVVATDDGIALYRDGTLHAFATTSRLSQLRLTETGLVAGIDANGEPMVLRPGESVFDHVALSRRAIGIATFGNVIAMSFVDGSVEVLDTDDQREWVIQAHPEEPWSLRLLAHDRLLTSGRSELRLWTLPGAAPQIVATLPTQANNVVFDAAGDALFGGNDGVAYVVKHGDTIASAVHRHDAPYAFGVAWCDTQACSSASGGKILCTDLRNGISRVALDVGANPPWMSAGRDHCFTAGSMSVYDVGAPSMSPVYEHGHDVYRVAATADGRYVASGDWGGEIIVYDNTTRHVTAKKNVHSGLVSNVAWSGEILVTSGVDGFVEASTPWLVPLRTWQLGSPVRYLDADGGAIGAGLDDGSLWFASVRGDGYRVSINATFGALAMSPSGKWLAAGTLDGEVVVITADRRAAAARFEHGRVSCLGFDSDSSLLVCTPSGQVMRVPLAGMSFQPLIRREP